MTMGERGPMGDHGQTGADGRTGLTGQVGERGPMGDHGQAGADGRTGQTGVAGDEGAAGPIGPPGSVLSKAQTLAGFLFVVVAFLVLSYIVQNNNRQIQEGVERQDQFLTEVCQRDPDLAPATCSIPR